MHFETLYLLPQEKTTQPSNTPNMKPAHSLGPNCNVPRIALEREEENAWLESNPVTLSI